MQDYETFLYLCTENILNTCIMVEVLRISNSYMDMLGNLPNEDKIDLITQLVKSIKKTVRPAKETKDIFARFSTNWGGNMTTEEYADMLRSENIESTRTVEAW